VTSLLAEILEGEPLTAREREILEGAADGETAAQTGARLYLSSETVKSYRKRVIAKLGARNGTHAVALALRSGLLPMPRTVRVPAVVPRRIHR
jgi:DNA-binding CsgD family transcriptional regulator